MDPLDRKLMNILQEGLPLERDPYGIIAGQAGLTRQEVLERIRSLVESGHIRRLGGIFDSSAMGYTSLLVGASVPEEIFPQVAGFVNSFPGVTHNYRRDGLLNMWFILSFSREEEKDRVVRDLKNRFGLGTVLLFPRLRSFKLRVFFDMERA